MARLRQALELREKALIRDHLDTLQSMQNLELALAGQYKYDEAKVRHRHALELREKVLGRDHPDTLKSIGVEMGLTMAIRI